MTPKVVFFGNSESVFSDRHFHALRQTPCHMLAVVDAPPGKRSSTNIRTPADPPGFVEVARQAGIPAFEPASPSLPLMGRLIEMLGSAGEERTLWVICGDHGEALGEHRERTHGMLLYDSTLRVPLLISAPGRAAAVRDDAVTLADVAPTILSAAGLMPPPEMTGRNLLDDGRPKSDAAAVRVQRQPDVYAETE